MRKIPTLYERKPGDRKHVIVGQVTPGCEWVLAGEGVPTRKWNGTCVALDMAGRWWARREVKNGKEPPPHFRLTQHDKATGKTVGWEPIEQSCFAKWHPEAIAHTAAANAQGSGLDATTPGTYEFVGPKINGNPDRMPCHALIRHGALSFPNDLSIEHLMESVAADHWEGVVWHHPDGRMCKLKVRDIPGDWGWGGR